MREKRDLGRWSICNRVCYQKEEGGIECECQSADISARGIRLRTGEVLRPDTPLNLKISLAEDLNPVAAKGKVVWQVARQEGTPVSFDTGVSFEDIKDPDREEIYKYAYQYKRDEITNRWWQGL